MGRRRVWTTQPPAGTPIDWDSPLTVGLVDVIEMYGIPRSKLLGTPATLFGTSQKFGQPTSQGVAFDTRASYAGVYFSRSDGKYATAAQTHIAVATYRSFKGVYSGLFATSDSSGNGSLSLQYSSPQDLDVYVSNSTGVSNIFAANSLAGVPFVVILSVGGGAGVLSITGDGGYSSSFSVAAPTTYSTSRLVLFGERSAGTSYASEGTYALHLFYDQVLSASTRAELGGNPWQIFHRRRRTYSIAASGGSTITGSAAVDESSDIAAGSGGISIAGAGATTEGADTASGAGTVSIAGAASAAESADTASAAGTAGSSITGSGAAAEGADTGAGTGAVSISGAGAATEQRDSAGGAGSISVSATGAVHEGADAAAAAGSLSISGAANATEGTDKAAGTGSATGTLGAPGSIPSVARYTIRRQVARNFTVWRSVSRNFAVRRSLVRVFEVNSVSLRFPVKGPLEAVPLTFDFSADLPSGVTLSGAPTMSIACTEGTDANAANVISGSVALNAAKTGVVQDGTGGLDGCEYTITCTCATTQSNLTLTLVGILAVRANLN